MSRVSNAEGSSRATSAAADPGEREHQRQRRFEAVYEAHRGPILGYVLRRTGNPDDA